MISLTLRTNLLLVFLLSCLMAPSLSFSQVIHGIPVAGNRDFPGGDYSSFGVYSLEACVKNCVDDDRCQAFSFDPRTSTCWLKDRVADPVRSPGIKSGRKVSGPEHSGGTYRPLNTPLSTPSQPVRYWNYENDVEITVVDDRGREFPQYPLRREGKVDTYRAFLEAREDKNYKILVHNRSDRRIGVVIAVDGRNIISGKKSWLRADERMYVLDPYKHATYEGWRTDKNWVNRFYFTIAADSYAEAWGDSTAMGVIAVAVYRERQHSQPWRQKDKIARPEIGSQSRRAPGTVTDEAARDEAGTGYGDKDWSPSHKVTFEAEQHPTERYFLKYEWRRTLCSKGIARCDNDEPPRPRNRFWNDRDSGGYAPPPPGYRD